VQRGENVKMGKPVERIVRQGDCGSRGGGSRLGQKPNIVLVGERGSMEGGGGGGGWGGGGGGGGGGGDVWVSY